MPIEGVEGSNTTRYVCDWCGKTAETDREGLPDGWHAVDYDTNKYTDAIDEAVVCSVECEVRLADKFAAGGMR